MADLTNSSGGYPRSDTGVLLSTADGDSFDNGFLRTADGALAATTSTTGMRWENGFRRAAGTALHGFGPLVYELDGTVAYIQNGLARAANGALAVTTTTTDEALTGSLGFYRDLEGRLVVAVNTDGGGPLESDTSLASDTLLDANGVQ